MGKLVLVTGGARSGKSRFAEEYAARFGTDVAYIATAQVLDKEMQFRVDLHKRRRPKSWQTYEAPFRAQEAIRAASREHDMILFDCLTLYISNMLCRMDDFADAAANYERLQQDLTPLIEEVKAADSTVVFVTNEVGGGIVPENHLAREYRDLVGIANQLMARAADEVYWVVAGIAVDVKKIGVSL